MQFPKRGPDYQAKCDKCGFSVSGFDKRTTERIAKRDHHHCKETPVIGKAKK